MCSYYPVISNWHSHFIVLDKINGCHPHKLCQLPPITCCQWHTICSLHFDLLAQPLSFSPANMVAFKCTGTKLILTNYSFIIDNVYIFVTFFKLTLHCDITRNRCIQYTLEKLLTVLLIER